MNLVIVESPTKAKTISKFLGKKFIVKSSFGHIRDLPKGDLGIDVKHHFTPRYVIPTRARKVATDLRKTAARADTIIFATDEDREGEAISWHLKEIFAKELGDELEGKKLERIVFHEITEEAIAHALKNPRSIDMAMVDAQQARRILDRLVGYELSPLLWEKIARGLSAGRVQSVTLRLIIDREREIQAFTPEEYWTIEGLFVAEAGTEFEAKLIKIGKETLEKFSIRTTAEAQTIVGALEGAAYRVDSVERKTSHRSPAPPLTTSTLQQDANHKLGFSAKQTMVIAQQLYEGVDLGSEGSVGLITYMRTDSVSLSERFLGEARALIKKRFGDQSLPEKPRFYKAKSKLTQEAHEAVRPTAAHRTPESVEGFLEPNQKKLYELIWRRAIASQMTDAELETTSADILGAEQYTFRTSGTRVTHEGFLAVLPDSGARPETIPALTEGETARAKEILPKQHFTEPPARFSDASLVKALEEYGIGRPSTYAPTIATILERNYVERIEGRRLKPTEIGFLVNDLLVEHFPNIVDYNFTAKMEEELDEIAEGKKEWMPVIRAFYEPFIKTLNEKRETLVKKEPEVSDEKCDRCGKPMLIKFGRFGKFLACSGFPECHGTKSLGKTPDGQPAGTGVTCPKCGNGEMVARRSKRGRIFWSCNTYPTCDFALWKKPTGEKCQTCGSFMVAHAKDRVACSNKECPSLKKSMK